MDLNSILIDIALVAANTVILVFGYIFKRAFKNMDKQINLIHDDYIKMQSALNGSEEKPGLKTRVSIVEERQQESETLHNKTDDKLESVINTIRELTSDIHAINLKNASDLGDIKAQVSEIIGMIKARDNG